MKLFVIDRQGNKKYIDLVATSRMALVNQIGSRYMAIEGVTYDVSEIKAELSEKTAPISTVIGGALGLVGGMPGVLLGGALGALFGSDADKKELARIDVFNKS